MKSDFIKYQAQTTPHPLSMEVERAEGSYIYDTSGKRYLDFIAGVSACSLGHQHPRVKDAIKTTAGQISSRNGVWRICAISSGTTH